TATQRQQRGGAVMALFQQGIVNKIEGIEVFEGFAIGQDHFVHLQPRGLLQGRFYPLQVIFFHRFISNNQNLAALDVRGIKLGTIQQAGTDINRIAAIAQVNRKGMHGYQPLISRFNSWTTQRRLRWSVSIIMSATSRYSGSRLLNSSRSTASGLAVCSNGRFLSLAVRASCCSTEVHR